MAPLQRDDAGKLTLSRDWIPIVATVLGLLGGIGGTAGFNAVVPARPDPFTGTMGQQLEARLLERIAEVERDGSRPVRDLQARLGALEIQRGELSARLTRIEELLIEVRSTLGINNRRQP